MISTSPESGGFIHSLTLRPERPEDEPLLYEVYASTRADELAITGWDAATQGAFLQMQFRAMRHGYAQMFPQGEFSLILREDRPVGRLVVDRGPGDIRVVDIALLPAFCGQGIGTELMRRLLAEGIRSQLPVRLKVIAGSRAVRFYSRLGFLPVGDQDVYQEMEWRPRPPAG